MTIWTGQDLTFSYNFPVLGDVFTGSPINFVADGSSHLSTLSSLSPATFSVTGIAPNEAQISYLYPASQYPSGFILTPAAFNGFVISGPSGDSSIVAAFVDPSSTATGLNDASVGFSTDSVTVNLAGDNFFAGSVGLIDVQFAVPEPSTWPIMILGLCALCFLVYRRRFLVYRRQPLSGLETARTR
jgi:PEP-CTERM motif